MKEDLLNALKLQININENEENDKVINYKEKPNNNYRGNILSEKQATKFLYVIKFLILIIINKYY